MLAKELQEETLSQGKECKSNADCKESEACPGETRECNLILGTCVCPTPEVPKDSNVSSFAGYFFCEIPQQVDAESSSPPEGNIQSVNGKFALCLKQNSKGECCKWGPANTSLDIITEEDQEKTVSAHDNAAECKAKNLEEEGAEFSVGVCHLCFKKSTAPFCIQDPKEADSVHINLQSTTQDRTISLRLDIPFSQDDNTITINEKEIRGNLKELVSANILAQSDNPRMCLPRHRLDPNANQRVQQNAANTQGKRPSQKNGSQGQAIQPNDQTNQGRQNKDAKPNNPPPNETRKPPQFLEYEIAQLKSAQIKMIGYDLTAGGYFEGRFIAEMENCITLGEAERYLADTCGIAECAINECACGISSLIPGLDTCSENENARAKMCLEHIPCEVLDTLNSLILRNTDLVQGSLSYTKLIEQISAEYVPFVHQLYCCLEGRDPMSCRDQSGLCINDNGTDFLFQKTRECDSPGYDFQIKSDNLSCDTLQINKDEKDICPDYTICHPLTRQCECNICTPCYTTQLSCNPFYMECSCMASRMEQLQMPCDLTECFNDFQRSPYFISAVEKVFSQSKQGDKKEGIGKSLLTMMKQVSQICYQAIPNLPDTTVNPDPNANNPNPQPNGGNTQGGNQPNPNSGTPNQQTNTLSEEDKKILQYLYEALPKLYSPYAAEDPKDCGSTDNWKCNGGCFWKLQPQFPFQQKK